MVVRFVYDTSLAISTFVGMHNGRDMLVLCNPGNPALWLRERLADAAGAVQPPEVVVPAQRTSPRPAPTP